MVRGRHCRYLWGGKRVMEEVWKPAPFGWGWKYEVSSAGNVRHVENKRNLKPMRTGTRRQGSQRSKVRFSTHPRVDFDVAHLVLTAFIGPRPEGHVAMHKDDDSTNNALTNLAWGTRSDNVRDSVNKVRAAQQKLSRLDVETIRARRSAGESGASLARRYGVSQQRICDVYKGRSIF